MLYNVDMAAKQSKREDTNYIQTGFRISEETHTSLKVIAAKQGKSLNLLLEEIVNKFISSYQNKHGNKAL